jgi:hypothetical protein
MLRMKKLFGLLACLALLIPPAMAQNMPRTDLSAGYSLRLYTLPDYARVGMNGWYASADYNIFHWLGAAAEGTGAYRNNGTNGNTAIYTALVGPQFYPLGHGHRLTLFGHFLAGEAYYRVHYPAFGGFPPKINSDLRFSWETGGGVEMTRSAHWGIRLFELDYGKTHFFGPSQNNYRLSIGVIYRFGGT